MKKILLGLLLTCSLVATAQVHNNEWIDYSKTYYKFKLGKDGLYRISQAVLANAGLGATLVEHFQLWRNGVQVPIYTSVASGALPVSGYIEFWGKMNDGRPDRQLYRNPSYQLNDKWSLLTDTATYFLTVNTAVAENLRLESAANNIAGNTLPAEPYFMYTAGNYFKNKINSGYAVPVGENLYSSSYDKGEGWSSADIETKAVDSLTTTYGSNTSSLNNLFVYNGGPSPSFKISVSGNAVIARRYKVTINGDSVLGNQVNFFDFATDSTTFALSKILTNTASVVVTNIASVGCYDLPGVGYTCQRDRMVIHKYELTYPRLFNFGGASNFEFKLPASAVGNYLEITGFSAGTATPPVLYDLTNHQRYVADMSAAPLLKFVLPPSADARNFVLVSEDASNLNNIAALETRNFIDYSSSDKAGDYLIISNSVLFNGSNGTNPVEDYKTYRSSTTGGGYNAQVYLADQLIDQFGFGIKKNPLGIRNFIRFARLTYPVQPKYVFIIGRGVMYVHQKTYENNANPVVRDNLAKLNLVPTFGYPASDILLTAEPGSSLPLIPIGRLSVINPQEISDYLNKVKEYEAIQASTSSTAADKMWMKNVVHIVGASDEKLDDILTNSMEGFKKIISDTSFGAKVSTFSKHSANDVEQLSSADLTNLINQGTSLITYFGHSSSTTLEFNLDNPENYTNQGKYPFFFGLGCNAGNFFSYSTTRLATKETISEKYVLTPNRGTIGFIASTHFGIVHYLDIWNTRAYKRITNSSYGKSIGEIVRLTAKDVFDAQSEEDFYARANIEETELHGDPAIALNAPAKPDYVIEDPMVKVSPGFVSVADASFRLDAKFLNIGRAGENIVVEVKRQLPDQSVTVIKRDTIFRTSDRTSTGFSRFEDSISILIPIEPNHDKGLNKIIVTVDADNDVDEIFETNNSATKEVMIYEDEARPIYPYNYAIVNVPTVKLIASTANPFSPSKEYRMEMDTTELFNSPFKIIKTVTKAGGTMDFDPGITLTDSTVYYWRVAPVPASGPYSWNTASFIYLPNSDVGFNQSHYYQHLKSANDKVSLNPDSRKWDYGTVMQNLFIRQGTWATSSGQQIAFSVAVNAETIIQIASWFQSLMFNVFDPVTFKPWKNQVVTPAVAFPNNLGSGLYNSLAPQNFAQAEPLPYNFEFRYTDTSSRRKIMDFMRDVIPDGAYVVVRNFTLDPSVNTAPNFPVAYATDWAKDTTLHGAGQSIYHYLKDAGLAGLDSFYRARPFALVYKKGDPNFTPKWMMGEGIYDNPTLSVDCPTIDTVGFISSPKFGPAKEWKELKWRGSSLDNSGGDYPTLSIVGYGNNGQVDTLYRGLDVTQQSFDISTINASQYPYLQLQMRNIDSVHYTPYQLRFWRFTYVPAPEGAVSPNIFFS
ncbi:MAG TPA: C25 family cysteine peptidase, partial [Flavisolibacter sp.]|nr:C25 family cysteine peptidase [Flavisolibacter sp.]